MYLDHRVTVKIARVLNMIDLSALLLDSSGNVTAKNTASSSYPYLSFSSSKYFMVGSSAPTGLYFWKETTTSTGGSSTTYYTTG